MKTQLLYPGGTAKCQGCVMAYGHFSTIHPGHIRYLRHAKNLGEQLVVALVGDEIDDKDRRYAFNQSERAEALSLLGLTDAIYLLKGDALSTAIREIRPQTLVVGNELEGAARLEEPIKILQSQGGNVQFHAGDVQYASTDLLTIPERDLRRQRRIEFQRACKRQKLTYEMLVDSMNNWSRARLIVLGDTIVDQYAACEAIGMSAEAPVVVVRELAKRNFLGGAGVVAAHIRALGAKCDLVSVVGKDKTAELVEQELRIQGIGSALVSDKTRPTTFKKRYVVESQKLFRVSRLEQHNLEPAVEAEVISRLEELAPKANGIVVSDFVYGVITPRILESVTRLSVQHNLKLFGDLQCSSQVGSIAQFKNYSLLCPNERELRLALQDKDSGIECLSQRLLEDTGSEKLLVKLAAEGVIAYDRDERGKIYSQAFPALSVNPLDVAGAGDSVLAGMATGLASGESFMTTVALACCMAEIAVDTMGNTPIKPLSILRNLAKTVEV